MQVAKALVNKGVTHGERDESEAELAAYDDLVARFGDSDSPDLRAQVAKTLVNKGIRHYRRGEHEPALAAWNAVAADFGADDTPEIQQALAAALVYKGTQQVEIGRAQEALGTSDEIDRRFGRLTDHEPDRDRIAVWRWRAKWIKANALLVQGEHPAALSVFRLICAMFVAGNETMLSDMLAGVPVLLTVGASERELAKILLAEKETADALAPLAVALRLLAGESVRAPVEMLEVAADVRKNIEEAKRRRLGKGGG